MPNCVIDGKLFREMVRVGAADLRANAAIVNDLNVFPIPDGDTGDNMSMTIEGGVAAAVGKDDDSLGKISGDISGGMLLSARGNSGVILSQFFAGIAEGFAGLDTASPADLGNAFRSGVRYAYKSVGNPVEGTILTVAREATEFACSNLSDDSTVESFFEDFSSELNISLKRTPELLAVLKEAGVVDSGGAGLVFIVAGMKRALAGDVDVSGQQTSAPKPSAVDISLFTENDVMTFGYCTECLLRLQSSKVDLADFDENVIADRLNEIGDSLVLVRNGSVVKIHVHTLNPGNVLNFCQQFGEFLTLKIENMTLQHTETRNAEKPEYGNTPVEFRLTKDETPKKPYGVVAVATGEGIKETFRSLGADVIVDGGQTNNPSAEDFIKAFDEAHANTIFVLPDNSNIRMAAEQAAGMYADADVRVIDSKTIGDGYAALTMLDYSSGDTDAIAAGLTEAMECVVTGQVTYAVRDAKLNGIDIKKGDFIGFCGKEMLAAAEDKVDAAFELSGAMDAGDHDLLIIVSGKSADENEVKALYERVKNAYPMTEIYCIDGGQDVYDFILIAE